MESLPWWLTVQEPADVEFIPGLHAGETHAIALGLEVKADLLLIDERPGTQAARERRLRPMGLLGVLDRAAEHHLIQDVPKLLHELTSRTNFRMSPSLRQLMLDRDAERRRN